MGASADKICPECGQTWKATFKFCPEDGVVLPEPVDDAPISRRGERAQRETRVDRRREQATAPIGADTGGAVKRRREQPTVALEPVKDPAAGASSQDAATAASPRPAASQPATSAKPARADTPVPACEDTEPTQAALKSDTAKPSKRGGRKGFSETAWFMAAIDDKAIDPETGQVKVDSSEYRARDLAPDERARYTLRPDGDND